MLFNRVNGKSQIKSICLICVVALTLCGCKKYTDVKVQLRIDYGLAEIAHGGYFQLSYGGKTYKEDFGSGGFPECTFYDIELNNNKTARVKACVKNGWGTVVWTKEEEVHLWEGTCSIRLSAESKELE